MGDKTIAIAFNKETKALAYEIWKKEECIIEEAVNKAFEILLPKFLEILDDKKEK